MTDKRESFRPAQGEIPILPGVYRFSDRNDRVLYIGKAKNLRSRVSNYFQPLRSLPPRTQRMLQLANKLDWTVVGSDTEALTLEHNWIGEFQPPFNVQFRDDKTYPSLAVTLKDEAPRLVITRNRKIAGAKYYGPFPKMWALKQLAGALQEAFPIRTCNTADYTRAMNTGKPCLSSQIGQCYGPCSQKISIEEHLERVQEMIRFLNGYDKELLQKLQREMQEASTNLEFEIAAKLRDQITGINHVLEHNAMVLQEHEDLDVFGLTVAETRGALHQFVIRGGRVRSEFSQLVNFELDDSKEKLLEQAIQATYDNLEVPRRILVPFLPDSVEQLTEVLTQKHVRHSAVKIYVPERGEKKQILDRAMLNAAEQLNRFMLRRANDLITRTDALNEIALALELSEPPMRIESVDISHLHGTGIVASLVTFVDGLPNKSDYRSYRIREATDDTSAVNEVISRRAKQLHENSETANKTPDLFLIDGGLPQVNAAYKALKANGLEHVAVCSIAKRLEEVWAPGADFPIIFARSSEALFLLQRIRDEAHRFAVTLQRKTRKASLTTALTDIPGVGAKRANALLKEFGSVKGVKQANIAQISNVAGISKKLAEQIWNNLAGESANLDVQENNT